MSRCRWQLKQDGRGDLIVAPRSNEEFAEFIGQFKQFMKQAEEAQKAAATARAQIYKKLEEQSLKIDRLETHAGTMEGRMDEVEDSSDSFNVWKQRFIGMAMIVTLFSSAVAAVVTFMLKKMFVLP